MTGRPTLRLDWCSYEAARYAVTHWHYSGKMPASKLARIGVWEDERFVGAVIYGVGAGGSTNGTRWGLRKANDVAELVRVALREHVTPTSRIVAISLRMVAHEFPGLRLITSFADTAQGHAGTLYQAGGWVYLGRSSDSRALIEVHGKAHHPKSLHARYGVGGQSIPWLREHVDPNARRLYTPPKHHYVYPLDAEMRARITPLAKPYPKQAPE